jgi:uncharacterized protein DUF1697
MPELREALEDAGFKDVQTYLQSGNVVLTSRAKPETVSRKAESVIAERYGLEIAVVVRTLEELAKVVKRNPLGRVAKNPKADQVTFMSAELDLQLLEAPPLDVAHPNRYGRTIAGNHYGVREQTTIDHDRVDVYDMGDVVDARTSWDVHPGLPCSGRIRATRSASGGYEQPVLVPQSRQV